MNNSATTTTGLDFSNTPDGYVETTAGYIVVRDGVAIGTIVRDGARAWQPMVGVNAAGPTCRTRKAAAAYLVEHVDARADEAPADDYTVDGSQVFHGDTLIAYVGETVDADGDVVGGWSRFINQDTPSEFSSRTAAIHAVVDAYEAHLDEDRVFGIRDGFDHDALSDDELVTRERWLAGLLRNGDGDPFGMNAAFEAAFHATAAAIDAREAAAAVDLLFANAPDVPVVNNMIPFEGHTAPEWAAKSRGADQAKAESFDRCDTDGFLSQWAHGVMAGHYSYCATVARNGGTISEGWCFDLDGNPLEGRWIDGKFGRAFMAGTPGNRSYLNPSRASNPDTARSRDADRGFYYGTVRVRGEVDRRTGGAVATDEVVAIVDDGIHTIGA